jgi:nicotinic acid phosphoribosyltransferase
VTSTALLTDHYELTMLQAAIHSGASGRHCVFEVFARRLMQVVEQARTGRPTVIDLRDPAAVELRNPSP